MFYIHNKTGVLYKLKDFGQFQNKKGEWKKCVIYENYEGMTFVRLQEDFDKSFTKKEHAKR